MPPLRRTGLAVVAVLAAVSGCGSSSSSPSAPGSSSGGASAVTIQNFAFMPAAASAKVGTAVTWTNQDSTAHTATSDPGVPASFSTGNIGHGTSASFTFQTPGTYPYHCSIHPYMKATITVTG